MACNNELRFEASFGQIKKKKRKSMVSLLQLVVDILNKWSTLTTAWLLSDNLKPEYNAKVSQEDLFAWNNNNAHIKM